VCFEHIVARNPFSKEGKYEMDLKKFAEKYRVKMTRGRESTEDLVLGKYGEIADAYGDGKLRLRLLTVPRDGDMNKALNIRKADAKAGGLKPVHVSEHVYESIWSFDPANAEHSQLAIKLVGPKRRRRVNLTEEQRAAAKARLAAGRQIRAQMHV
jgi:hypothetical protein